MANDVPSTDAPESTPEAAAVQSPESLYVISPENGERVLLSEWLDYRDGKTLAHPETQE